jgi:hypothetical protein
MPLRTSTARHDGTHNFFTHSVYFTYFFDAIDFIHEVSSTSHRRAFTSERALMTIFLLLLLLAFCQSAVDFCDLEQSNVNHLSLYEIESILGSND